jgi:hypothetical protein
MKVGQTPARIRKSKAVSKRFGQMLSKLENFLIFVSWTNPASR